jgi:hypothetical protein
MSSAKEVRTLVDHLFRHEAGRMVAILTRIFGIHNLELAEDVLQDTLRQTGAWAPCRTILRAGSW